MGIYIKGMEMPKNCNECKFGTWSNLHQTACCKRHDFDPCFKDHSREYMEKRADFCPLVEIPDPHGALIDRDALKNIKFTDTNHDYRLGWNDAIESIMENADVVIEAEGSEDE